MSRPPQWKRRPCTGAASKKSLVNDRDDSSLFGWASSPTPWVGRKAMEISLADSRGQVRWCAHAMRRPTEGKIAVLWLGGRDYWCLPCSRTAVVDPPRWACDRCGAVTNAVKLCSALTSLRFVLGYALCVGCVAVEAPLGGAL